MKRIATDIPEVVLLKPKLFRDDRGWFCETYNESVLADLGITDKFVQDNESASCYGVVRGLHFQKGECWWRGRPNPIQADLAAQQAALDAQAAEEICPTCGSPAEKH